MRAIVSADRAEEFAPGVVMPSPVVLCLALLVSSGLWAMLIWAGLALLALAFPN